MSGLLEYKCPNCGGAISFDSTAQKMVCPYCDSQLDVSALQSYDAQLQYQAPEPDAQSEYGAQWGEGEQESMTVYACSSCGGEIICDVNTAATSCPYCGNPVVMTSKLSGTLKPDLVIPFKLDKKAAMEQFGKHLSGKRLLPKVFTKDNHIDEVKGVYVPVWLFDCDVDVNAQYRATRVHVWTDTRYQYTETSYYNVFREGTVGFDRIPVDGSTKVPNDLFNSIEPFNYGEAVSFQTAYLSGYFADKYDVSAEDSEDDIYRRISTSAESLFSGTVQGFSTVTPNSVNVNMSGKRVTYALLPVWFLHTTWKDQKYLFAMNGQTGKFVGDLPTDTGAYWRWFFGLFLGIGVPAAALASLITSLL